MFKRRKGFTAAGGKLISYRMRKATLGTHVERHVRPSRRHMNADAVGFSSSRKKRRAARGLVDHVTPRTSSAESGREYARRVSRKQYPQAVQRKARSKRVFAIALAAVFAVCLAAGVGSWVFVGSVNGKLALENSDAASALAAQTEDVAYYVLCVADLRESQAQKSQFSTRDSAYALVRVDEAARTVTVVDIPVNLQVKLNDGAYHPLHDALSSGDAALVEAVSDFAGVSVSHIVKTDAAGIAHLVDAVGGVSVTLTEEVDDPIAGTEYLPQGEVSLDADSSLTLLRTANYAGGSASQAANRTAFFCALASRLALPSGFVLVQQVDDLAGDVRTDWDLFGIMSVADALREGVTYYTGAVPGSKSATGESDAFSASSDQWSAVMALVDAGGDPTDAEPVVPEVDPAGVTVAVRNGTVVVGSAATTAQILTDAGFSVAETGNVDDYTTYPETLVIYKDDAYKDAAAAVSATLDAGRVVNGGSYYTFSANVLVIIGKDYQPIV